MTKMNKSMSLFKRRIEELGLDTKDQITEEDVLTLNLSLEDEINFTLSSWHKTFKCPEQLQDFIVNELFG